MTGRGNPPKVKKIEHRSKAPPGKPPVIFISCIIRRVSPLNMKDTSKKSFSVLSVDILTPRRCFASVLRHTIK